MCMDQKEREGIRDRPEYPGGDLYLGSRRRDLQGSPAGGQRPHHRALLGNRRIVEDTGRSEGSGHVGFEMIAQKAGCELVEFPLIDADWDGELDPVRPSRILRQHPGTRSVSEVHSVHIESDRPQLFLEQAGSARGSDVGRNENAMPGFLPSTESAQAPSRAGLEAGPLIDRRARVFASTCRLSSHDNQQTRHANIV